MTALVEDLGSVAISTRSCCSQSSDPRCERPAEARVCVIVCVVLFLFFFI